MSQMGRRGQKMAKTSAAMLRLPARQLGALLSVEWLSMLPSLYPPCLFLRSSPSADTISSRRLAMACARVKTTR
jgi:hypothetical protein